MRVVKCSFANIPRKERTRADVGSTTTSEQAALVRKQHKLTHGAILDLTAMHLVRDKQWAYTRNSAKK